MFVPDRVAFSIGNFHIYWYGVLMACAVLISVLYCAHYMKKKNFPEDAIYNFVKGVFDYQEDISAAHDKGKELSLETAVSGIDIDFHPGAAKYFTEQGAM